MFYIYIYECTFLLCKRLREFVANADFSHVYHKTIRFFFYILLYLYGDMFCILVFFNAEHLFPDEENYNVL